MVSLATSQMLNCFCPGWRNWHYLLTVSDDSKQRGPVVREEVGWHSGGPCQAGRSKVQGRRDKGVASRDGQSTARWMLCFPLDAVLQELKRCLERLQTRAAKMVKDLENTTYEEQLNDLGLLSLQEEKVLGRK